MLRWCENPVDRVAGFRTLQLLPGVGPSTAAKILDASVGFQNSSYLPASINLPRTSRSHWLPFVELVTGIRQGKHAWPSECAMVREWYEPYLEGSYDDAPARKSDLTQLEAIAASFPSRAKFLTEITLDPPESGRAGPSLPDEDHFILSTIHSAKGQEWQVVHVLNTVEGRIPSDKAADTSEDLEEERRLLYVAMTRAKDELNLIIPLRFYVSRRGDHGIYASLSRFIPPAIQQFFEHRTWIENDLQPVRITETTNLAVDVQNGLLRRWLESA